MEKRDGSKKQKRRQLYLEADCLAMLRYLAGRTDDTQKWHYNTAIRAHTLLTCPDYTEEALEDPEMAAAVTEFAVVYAKLIKKLHTLSPLPDPFQRKP